MKLIIANPNRNEVVVKKGYFATTYKIHTVPLPPLYLLLPAVCLSNLKLKNVVINNAKIKVFYADDDEDDRFVFESAIRELAIPVELTCFSGGYKMERMLAECNYDCELVFLDLNMPGKSGLETLDSLQNAIIAHQLKIIIFTTSAEKPVVQKTHSQNAVRFVQKPVNFSLLVATLGNVIDCRHMLQLPVPFQDFEFNLERCQNFTRQLTLK